MKLNLLRYGIEKLRTHLGKRAREIAENNHSWLSIAHKYLSVYQEILNKSDVENRQENARK